MKKIKTIIKLQIPAGQATPAPPVGPALAQHGVNIAEFCQKFNNISKGQLGFIIPVEITVYQDRTYVLKLKQPPASELLKKAAGIEKGSGTPNKTKVAKITRAQLKEIAQKKLPDLNTTDIDQAMKTIEGTAKNMGIEIEK
ncbi:MAG: 50S ribosomal protein L11 [Candidatus Nealsonbacteria bacterium CG10_big_fil_rev_8_21_14_0_10_36_24]|uniref:Large ribosomal subunit protein uL11 n=2 Tax=Candidatus Nealsoniibacteriota TaxID=1817911 RepID=A0A2H0YP46_9BACT|nr:MAG: 50S ribosomal protein L11 [Candidatus Nealsonbacteria bacterium CG10_big_fil_rev_8_21_14_0_10_36_24]PIS40274.1 MAG: 50S ribosomal protein L11 [Candidatus Nealsonbacteria bacterium CG08_land_8_20_14_0_20_36_22]